MRIVQCVGTHIHCWGPAGWIFLHAIANDSPPSLPSPEGTWRFLHLFGEHLPCAKCARHFKSFLEQRPIPRTREQLVHLLHDAHNDVNRRLGKRALSLEAHERLYAPTDASPMSSPLSASVPACACACACAAAALVVVVVALVVGRRR